MSSPGSHPESFTYIANAHLVEISGLQTSHNIFKLNNHLVLAPGQIFETARQKYSGKKYYSYDLFTN